MEDHVYLAAVRNAIPNSVTWPHEIVFVTRNPMLPNPDNKVIEITQEYSSNYWLARWLFWLKSRGFVSRWKILARDYQIFRAEITETTRDTRRFITFSFHPRTGEFPEPVLHPDYRAVSRDERRVEYSQRSALAFVERGKLTRSA